MNRKYIVVKTATLEMIEVVGNRIYTDKADADEVCADLRFNWVTQSLTLMDLPEGPVPANVEAIAEAGAKSIIKVYELVATEIN